MEGDDIQGLKCATNLGVTREEMKKRYGMVKRRTLRSPPSRCLRLENDLVRDIEGTVIRSTPKRIKQWGNELNGAQAKRHWGDVMRGEGCHSR